MLTLQYCSNAFYTNDEKCRVLAYGFSVWMDPVTKNNALDKAEAMDEFVAYPNELLDAHKVDDYYSPLRLDDDGHYFESMLHLAKFECDKNFERLHAPVNKSDWVTHGRAVVFNAFYNLVENSIQFPAGKSISKLFIRGAYRKYDFFFCC